MLEFNLSKLTPETSFNTLEQNKTFKSLIFGIRPCDSRGYAAFDLTFDAEFKDPYYLTPRNNQVIIGMACLKPDLNCFCSSVNNGPFDGVAMDIMMVDSGSKYIFNIYTEKGKRIIEPYQELFSEAIDADLAQANKLQSEAEAIVTRQMTTEGKPEKLSGMFESDYWDEISKKCLGCGICTYLCPTCYCFDITDEKWGYKGSRVRTWDSCMYPEYTVHASGYNPRPARLNRLRNRVLHKFLFYPNIYNEFGCTGCGRCIRHCPVNIDIIDIINGV
jgi:ferredoxin